LSCPELWWPEQESCLSIPLIQLVPLPNGLWRLLPGHGEYAEVLERFAAGGTSSLRHTISVIPSATEYGWLALLPPLACFLAVLHLRPEHIRSLLLWMVAFAGCEALLGLLQASLGGDSIFYLGNNRGYGTAVGTFVNRNHLAAMLAMMLPVVIGWFAFSLRRQRHPPQKQARDNQHNNNFTACPCFRGDGSHCGVSDSYAFAGWNRLRH
jgi:hypothetical protein